MTLKTNSVSLLSRFVPGQSGRSLTIAFGVLLAVGASQTGIAASGLYGHLLQGYAQPIGPASNLQNVSNLGSPNAVVGNGVEFSTDFNDIFGQPWHLTADFLDNYQLTLHTSSSNPSANIAGGTVGWNFSAFDLPIMDVQPLSLPP